MHYVFRSGTFPKREVERIAFFALSVKSAGVAVQVFYVSSGQDAVFMVGVVFFDIEINRAVAFVGIPCINYFLDVFDLFDYVA